jgi:FO synthase
MRRALRRAADGATLNVDEAAVLLFAQGDDLGGTLMEETISRMAGSQHGSARTVSADRVDRT